MNQRPPKYGVGEMITMKRANLKGEKVGEIIGPLFPVSWEALTVVT